MKILVTGSDGWIGRNICQLLLEKGHLVVGMDQQSQPANDVCGLCYVQGDISADTFVDNCVGNKALQSIEAIIHCAGYAHRANETKNDQKLFWAINRDGSRRIVDLAKRIGTNRIVYVSSIAFYKWDGEEPVEETGALDASTEYAKSKLAGEKIFRESGLDWRSVRLATVFGNGDRANFSKLFTAIKRRRFIVPGSGGAKKSVIPVNLAAEVLCQMAFTSNPTHRLINAALPEAPTLREICDGFADVCDFPAPKNMTMALFHLLACCGNVITTIRPGFPLTSITLRKLTTSTVVNTCRLEENFPSLVSGHFREWLRDAKDYYKQL